jgi:hypothetical protein
MEQQKVKEKWLPIPEYEGIYSVSNHGRIRKNPIQTISINRGETWSETIIFKASVNCNGYPVVSLSKNGIPENILVHRIVANVFLKNHENKPQVNHKDSVRTNNYYKNLEWCTSKENNNHCDKVGNRPKRSNHYKAKKVLHIASGVILGCLKDAADHAGINCNTMKQGLNKNGVNTVYKGYSYYGTAK